MRHHRSQPVNFSAKVPYSVTGAMKSSAKQNFSSSAHHSLADDNDFDELIDNDAASDALSTIINTFDSSLLSVKSIIPSTGPQHSNHHVLQHR